VSGTHQREGLGTPSSLDIYLYPLEAADIETVVVALTEIVVVIVGIAQAGRYLRSRAAYTRFFSLGCCQLYES
jgi:hypothetical protein